MSTAVKQFHEEEAIGKTYDFQIARRLLRYLSPYLRMLISALIFTLVLNLLGVLQPKFTQLTSVASFTTSCNTRKSPTTIATPWAAS
ncbi:MAG: hypothetical protein LC770_03115 [Acidobacteria bacterium]|nr:hypothetical protein [Acidobacteriota bacterium]